MKVRFDEIPAGGIKYDIDDVYSLDLEDGPVTVRVISGIFLENKGPERVMASGNLSTVLPLTCDRCLEPYDLPVCENFQVNCELGQGLNVGEHFCVDEEMDTIFLDEPLLSLADLVRDQIILACPEKRLCAEGCQGLCPVCGGNRNKISCLCAGDAMESAFSVLARLKKSSR